MVTGPEADSGCRDMPNSVKTIMEKRMKLPINNSEMGKYAMNSPDIKDTASAQI